MNENPLIREKLIKVKVCQCQRQTNEPDGICVICKMDKKLELSYAILTQDEMGMLDCEEVEEC